MISLSLFLSTIIFPWQYLTAVDLEILLPPLFNVLCSKAINILTSRTKTFHENLAIISSEPLIRDSGLVPSSPSPHLVSLLIRRGY